MIICKLCGQEKEEAEFYRYGNVQKNICKKCHSRRCNTPEKREYLRQRNQELRRIVIKGYGGKCACCGEGHHEFLSIDHINGDGQKHRKEKGRTGILSDIIKNNFPKNYQILCHNCNLALGFYGYCPHRPLIFRKTCSRS